MTTADVERLYPYTRDDIERIRPSQVRAGDLMAHRGPQGSDRWSGDLVLDACYGGTSVLGGELYLLTYRQSSTGYESTLHQPESLSVYRVRRDRIKREAL